MLARISRALDLFVSVFKWPMALLSLALLPAFVVAAIRLLGRVSVDPQRLIPFAVGILAYAVLWRVLLRRPAMGSLVPTLEHELTHVLFALLTLHPITDIRVTWRKGGSMGYLGLGNWLITIAPYFFPTISFALLALSLLLPAASTPWVAGLVGASMCYHVISTWRETHRNQPDLQRVGFLFAALFLPGANLACYAAVLALAYGRSAELGRFFTDVGQVVGAALSAVG